MCHSSSDTKHQTKVFFAISCRERFPHCRAFECCSNTESSTSLSLDNLLLVFRCLSLVMMIYPTGDRFVLTMLDVHYVIVCLCDNNQKSTYRMMDGCFCSVNLLFVLPLWAWLEKRAVIFLRMPFFLLIDCGHLPPRSIMRRMTAHFGNCLE